MSKEESYSVYLNDDTNGKPRFECDECGRVLSRKQRILTHLVSAHNKSPVKRLKKCYLHDESIPIPRRTLMRRRNNETTSPQPFGSDQDTDAESDTENTVVLSSASTGIQGDDESTSGTRFQIDKENECTEDLPNPEGMHMLANEENTLARMELPMDQRESGNEDSAEEQETQEDANLSSESDMSMYDIASSDSDSVLSDSDDSSSDSELVHSTALKLNDNELSALMILSYIIKHNDSQSSAKDLLQLLQALCPYSESLKTMEYSDVLKAAGDTSFDTIHYCSLCMCKFPDDPDIYICSTANCLGYRYKGSLGSQTKVATRQPRNVFVMADVKSQLTYLLEREGVWEQVKCTKAYISSQVGQPVKVIHDITDGESYRAACTDGKFLASEGNLSAVYNSDGIPLYSSSGVKLWPIYLAVNELYIRFRFLRENMILAAIWQGKDKPPFLEYFYAFAEQACELYNVGFSISPPCSKVALQSKMCVFLGCVDLQAKGYILNMTMHNGEYGCITCEEPGETVRQGRGTARCYPYRLNEDRFPERKSDDVAYVKGPAATRNHRVKGICGMTGLASMPWFDIVLGTVPDYMHGILLGITKTLMYKWFSSTQHAKAYFVGGQIKQISQRLQQIKPPDYVERLPRDLEKNFNHFKATELQTWLLFYAIPCLNGFLEHRFLEHFACLSEATHILLRDTITFQDLERAESLLDYFYSEFATLYGAGSCGLNVHNVGIHMVHYVRHWGPLFAWSCFGFEDWNAAVLKSVHGTGDVTKQILRLRQAQLKLRAMPLNLELGGPKERFLKKMTRRGHTLWSKTRPMAKCRIAGATPQLQVADGEVELVMASTGANSLSDLRKALRIQIGNQCFYAKEYLRMKKRICYVVRCKNSDMMEVHYFIVNMATSQVFAFGTTIELLQVPNMFARCGHHLLKVRPMEDRVIVDIAFVVDKLFFSDLGHVKFVSTFPNSHGKAVLM